MSGFKPGDNDKPAEGVVFFGCGKAETDELGVSVEEAHVMAALLAAEHLIANGWRPGTNYSITFENGVVTVLLRSTVRL